MGSKNSPGQFDCYHAADPDEPMFILLARDWTAPILVKLWADLREQRGTNAQKIAEARACAEAMVRWFNGDRESVEIPGVIDKLRGGA